MKSKTLKAFRTVSTVKTAMAMVAAVRLELVRVERSSAIVQRADRAGHDEQVGDRDQGERVPRAEGGARQRDERVQTEGRDAGDQRDDRHQGGADQGVEHGRRPTW